MNLAAAFYVRNISNEQPPAIVRKLKIFETPPVTTEITLEMAAHYRQILPAFLQFLEAKKSPSTSNWPKYAALKAFCRDNGWTFTEREYSRLRKTGFGREELVERLVQYYQKSFQGPLIDSIPTLLNQPDETWLNTLTQFADGHVLRRKDYRARASWRSLCMVFGFWSPNIEEQSVCRTEAAARLLAESAYIELAKSRLPRRKASREQVLAEGQTAFRQSLDEFSEMMVAFWRVVPECMWLNLKKSQPVSGSIVLPLTPTAFERLSNGHLAPGDIDPETDLQSPSRYLWIAAVVSLQGVFKPRLPGAFTARQIRGLAQHGAQLIGEDPTTTEPMHLMVGVMTKRDERTVRRFGYRPTGHSFFGLDSPILTMTTPAPERTRPDFFSTAASANAAIVGVFWRLAR